MSLKTRMEQLRVRYEEASETQDRLRVIQVKLVKECDSAQREALDLLICVTESEVEASDATISAPEVAKTVGERDRY